MVCRRSVVPPFRSSAVFSGIQRFRRGVAGHRSSLCGFEDSWGLSRFEMAVEVAADCSCGPYRTFPLSSYSAFSGYSMIWPG